MTQYRIADKVLTAPKGFYLIKLPEQKKSNKKLELVKEEEVRTNIGEIVARGYDLTGKVGDTAYFVNRGFETIFTVGDEVVRILSVKDEDIYLRVGDADE